MIYMDELFSNYEEFKELFGMQEHGDGSKSRRNKILLQIAKSRKILHAMATKESGYTRERVWDTRYDRFGSRKKWLYYCSYPAHINFYSAINMDKLKFVVFESLRHRIKGDINNRLEIEGLENVVSVAFRSDDFHGICEDGDIRSVRYINVERDRVFKMRAGKFLRKIIEEHKDLDDLLPEQVKIWICEDFAENWKAHAMNIIGRENYTLRVDKDFRFIYDGYNYVGSFGSCMTNEDYWKFYRDSVNASAACLLNDDGRIVARCVIYNEVKDGNDNTLRLAERQYASEGNNQLKMLLVMRLIEGKYIDGYKRIGADCHSPSSFVDVHGNPLENTELEISCNLEDYDVVSYQDSFKWYDHDDMVARNWGDDDDGNLSTTSGRINEDLDNDDDYVWSEYNQEHIYRDDAVWVESRDDYFREEQTLYAYVLYPNGDYCREVCFEDDCIGVGGDDYYAGEDANSPEDYGIYECPRCGDYFLKKEGAYSSITDETYCGCDCRDYAEDGWYEDNGYVKSDFDGEWHKADDCISVLYWCYGRIAPFTWGKAYFERIISIDEFNDLVEDAEATEFCGKFYIDDIGHDGEPLHFENTGTIAA